MEEKELTPQESMELIQSMIGKARRRYSDNSFFFSVMGLDCHHCQLRSFLPVYFHGL